MVEERRLMELLVEEKVERGTEERGTEERELLSLKTRAGTVAEREREREKERGRRGERRRKRRRRER